jgi:hypothetical protein
VRGLVTRNREQCVEVFSYDEFRDLLNVPPGTYERGLDFQRKVLVPALLEVNGLSDMGVDLDGHSVRPTGTPGENRADDPRCTPDEPLITILTSTPLSRHFGLFGFNSVN